MELSHEVSCQAGALSSALFLRALDCHSEEIEDLLHLIGQVQGEVLLGIHNLLDQLLDILGLTELLITFLRVKN